jgi:hypothetical protein
MLRGICNYQHIVPPPRLALQAAYQRVFCLNRRVLAQQVNIFLLN